MAAKSAPRARAEAPARAGAPARSKAAAKTVPNETPAAQPGTQARAGAKAPRSGPAASPLRRITVRRATLGPIGRLEDFIPFKLAVVANRVSQSIGHLFETRFGLQIPEWRILMALYAYGRQPFHEVVDRTSMDKARVSRAQRRLVDLRMIETAVDPADGRRLLMSITDAGARMCAQILPEAAAREAWYLQVLSDPEHRQLDLILDKLMQRSAEERA